MGFLRAAADASSKLMKLGEAEAFGMLDDHDGGVGDVDVSIKSERKRAWDGRGGEHKDVRRVAVGGGFVHQALALENAEAVLLVNGDKAEARECDVVFDEGVGANDELRFARADAIVGGGFLRGFHAADEQLDAIASFGEDAARG